VKQKNRIFIGTPCFEYKVNSNYVKTLLEFSQNNINFEPFFLHDSLITRARNELITQFYENQENFTHLLWLDGDVSIPASGLQELLNENVNVIATPIPIKDLTPGAHQSVRRTYEEIRPYVYKAEAAATGCFLMSKQSVIDLVKSSKYYFSDDYSERKIYNVFEGGIRDNQLMSEDWDICYKLRDLGYEIYVNSSFPVSHFGFHNYSRGPMLNKEVSKPMFSYD
jgi:hypothetical protein